MDYDMFTVRFQASTLEDENFDLVTALSSIPQREVDRLRRGLDEAAPRFVYSRTSSSGSPDAFSMLLTVIENLHRKDQAQANIS